MDLFGFGQVGASAVQAGASIYTTHQINKTNQEIAAAANAASAQQANDQMIFQRFMSDTAHQREVEDMKKAGLNPILSSGGQGASSASGAQGTVQRAEMKAPDLSSLGNIVNGALQASKSAQEINNLKTSEKESTARTENITEDTKNKALQGIGKQTENKLLSINLSNTSKQQKALETRYTLEKAQNELKTTTSKYDHYLERIRDTTDAIMGILPGGKLLQSFMQKANSSAQGLDKNYGISSKGRPFNKTTGEIYE